MTTLVWFRQDLRIEDNPALFTAAKAGKMLPVYIYEQPDVSGETHPLGGASKWWLHQSLQSLREELPGLVFLKGSARHIIPELAKSLNIKSVFWNRCYDPFSVERDTDIKADLKNCGIDAKSFKASLLYEPWELATKSGGPFKVYSPFWKSAQQQKIADLVDTPKTFVILAFSDGMRLDDLDLLPLKFNWANGWEKIWEPGSKGANKAMQHFLESGLLGYGDLRNRPDLPNVSRLSPHLHFGEISPKQVWHATQSFVAKHEEQSKDAHKFLSEIAWREFSYHLLYHFPTLPERNWKPTFDAYPWRSSGDDLKRWQKGQTGYPIVDAGMRELWQTGYMHNRVRMIAASFLVKHLRIHWTHGESWFRDTLVDADLANNAASWQWVAGSGADAAPYFRIFNPISQAEKFDPEANYIRRWVPELANLQKPYIFAPFTAAPGILKEAGIQLGKDYPVPIVDHATARQAALDGYDKVKQANASE